MTALISTSTVGLQLGYPDKIPIPVCCIASTDSFNKSLLVCIPVSLLSPFCSGSLAPRQAMFRKYCSTLPAPRLYHFCCKPSYWHQPPLTPPQTWLLLPCSHPMALGCCPERISSAPEEAKCSIPLRCSPNMQGRRSS